MKTNLIYNWRFFIILLLVSITLVFHFKLSHFEKTLDGLTYKTSSVSDVIDSGNSSVEILKTTDPFEFEYILRKGVPYPFASMEIMLDSALDISNYNIVEFNIKSTHPNRVPFVLGVEYDDGSGLPFHFNEVQLDIDTTYQTYQKSLTEFTTPDWWLNNKNKSKDDVAIDFTKTRFITVGSGSRSIIDQPEMITFGSVKFIGKRIWPYFVLLTSTALSIFYWLIWYFGKKNKLEVSINYAATENPRDGKPASAVQFISDNYMNPEISLAWVSDKMNLSESKISTEIKETTQLQFKQLLNQLRMEEAKRLLLNSEMRVSEIAYQVGFENVTHFNRIFKKTYQTSPSEFRKQLKTGEE